VHTRKISIAPEPGDTDEVDRLGEAVSLSMMGAPRNRKATAMKGAPGQRSVILEEPAVELERVALRGRPLSERARHFLLSPDTRADGLALLF